MFLEIQKESIHLNLYENLEQTNLKNLDVNQQQ